MLRRMKGATKIDFRITWIRKVVECLLTVTDRVVLDNFLKEEEGQNERLLRQVCDGRVSQWSASSKRPDGPKEKDTVPSSSEDTCPRFPYVKFWTTTEEVEVEEDVVRASTYIAETEATDESEAEAGEIAAAEDGVERGKELEAPVPSSRMAKDAATLSTDMSSLNLSKEGDAALSIASQMSPIGSMATVDDDRPESGASTVDAEIQKITMKKRVFRIVLHSEVGPVKQLEPLSSEEADRLADDPSGQQWLYLIRTTCGPIPIPDSEEAACREMPQHFEVDSTDTLEAEGFLDLLTQAGILD